MRHGGLLHPDRFGACEVAVHVAGARLGGTGAGLAHPWRLRGKPMRKKQGRLFAILALFGALSGVTAAAGELEVRVKDRRGDPVADAVGTVVVRGTAPGKLPVRPTVSSRVVDQKALAFTPYVEVFRPGDEVVYRNSDHTRHHVYSFSPIKAFEFVLA